MKIEQLNKAYMQAQEIGRFLQVLEQNFKGVEYRPSRKHIHRMQRELLGVINMVRREIWEHDKELRKEKALEELDKAILNENYTHKVYATASGDPADFSEQLENSMKIVEE